MRLYRLYFDTPLKLKPEIEGKFILKPDMLPKSDTIFAAVANVIAEIDGVETLKEFCKGNPRFSSAFPFHKDKLFFPKPLKPLAEIERDKNLHKAWKKKIWIEHELLKRPKAVLDVINSEERKSEFFIAKEEIPKFYNVNEVVRNAKHRINEQTQIFSVYTLSFTKNSGLFFLYSGEVNIDEAVKILGEGGLGGGKTVGYGKFIAKGEDYSWEISGKWNLLLSLCLPKRSEVERLRESYYSLIEREGWTNSSRKRKVRVLTEGSVIPRKIEGRILEEHVDGVKIYRNYLALTLPMGWWD